MLRREVEELKAVVDKYREEEESIRNAILAAQKLADASIKDAKDKAERIINDARISVEKEKVASKEIYVEIDKFKNHLLEIYENHIKLIKNIPSNNMFNEQEDAEIGEELNDKICINSCDVGSDKEDQTLDLGKIDINNNDNCIESGKTVESDNIKKKFENLKFGSGYNIKSESEDSVRGGFFRRKK